MNDADLELIREHPLFHNLKPSTIDALLANAVPREYPKGYLLFGRGDPAEFFYFIFDGWLKIFRGTPDGDEAIIGVFTRGEALAEAVAFVGKDYPASAEVVEPARVLPIRSSIFVDHIRREPEVALMMLASMSHRMHHLVAEIEGLKTQTATQRVCQFLLRRCSVKEGPAVISLPYDKTVISGRLGIKPESLSRILAKLRRYGIRTEKNRVMIPDVEVLARQCEGMDWEDRQAAD